MNKPYLIEPGTKYFFNETLKKHRLKNNKLNNDLVNFCLLLFFLLILFLFLYFKKKSKPSVKKQQMTNLEKQQYILKQIQKANEKKFENTNNLITNLPKYQNEFDKFY